MAKISERTVSAIGDTITGDGKYSPFYRSGPDLVNFFNQFGWSDSYGQDFPSRWSYTEQKILEANGTSNLDKIIIAAVDPRDFLDSECTVEESVEYL